MQIKKKDIANSRNFTGLNLFFSDDYGVDNGTQYIIFNIFERDWSRNAKGLCTATSGGLTVLSAGRRKNYDEWYVYDPDVTAPRADLVYLDNVGVAVFNGTKCRVVCEAP